MVSNGSVYLLFMQMSEQDELSMPEEPRHSAASKSKQRFTLYSFGADIAIHLGIHLRRD